MHRRVTGRLPPGCKKDGHGMIMARRKKGRKKAHKNVVALPESIRGVRLTVEAQDAIVAALAELPEQRQLFVLEYWLDNNATQAAIRAGYSAKTAYSIGWELLRFPDVAHAVSVIRGVVQNGRVSTVQERRETLTEIHRGRLSHFGSAGADGFIPNVGEENINSAALAEITTRVEVDKAGTGDGRKDAKGGDVAFITKLKLESKVAAIKELNEMDGIYPKDKATADFFDALKGANGIRFNVDVDLKPDEKPKRKAGSK